MYNVMGFLALFIAAITSTHAAGSEADYVNAHCQGVIEYRLPDRTRVDCLLPDHAIEYEYGKNWAESIGQSLHYAMHTGRRAGIVFINLDTSDRYGIERARKLIAHYNLPIDILDTIGTAPE